jgi:CheY-like chemotaxis protein
LIVDDTEGCRNGVARLLKHGGYDSLCSCNGSDALHALESTSPSLILLDLAMPVMDGLTFLTIVRSDTRWANLPVIVISGESEDGPMRQATELGATEVLSKGKFTAHQLLSSISRHVPAEPMN